MAVILIFCVLFNLAFCQETDYIEYLPGEASSRVVLAAPHAGWMMPDHIRDRPRGGCWDDLEERCIWEHDCGVIDTTNCRAVSGRDGWTLEQSYILQDEIENVTGSRPHLVVNHLHRSKMDANRYIDQAAFGDPDAEAAWRDFQGYINASKAAIGRMGLFIDIHGHGHPEQLVELGYTISSLDLDVDNINPNASSIKNIANYVSGSTPFESLLRGNLSFGACLEAEGYPSIPSPQRLSPEGEAYFSGGYNTQTHGSRYEGIIDGIQIESPSYLRNEVIGPEYTRHIAECINTWMNRHYPA